MFFFFFLSIVVEHLQVDVACTTLAHPREAVLHAELLPQLFSTLKLNFSTLETFSSLVWVLDVGDCFVLIYLFSIELIEKVI